MRSTKLYIGLALAILIVGIVAAPTVSAEAKTETIQPGYYLQASYEVKSTTDMSIKVTSKEKVDVFVLDEENFAKLDNVFSSYEIIEGGSFMDVTSVDAKITLEPGIYYLIIDNSDVHGEAYAGSAVSVTYDVTGGLNWTNIAIIAAVVIVAIVVVAFLLLRRRKRKKLASQQQAFQPLEPPAEPQ